ncbi:uncharacterized protein LOC126555491 [Aphis gossypii]|uniref:uncharacterized protein LOC126555491 n=1 Tax=Aphis gossypii TaxID=80765 RepID=UPI002158FC1E|nr:uncharacterized protein LOC126555491 [Aphis gossypii]
MTVHVKIVQHNVNRQRIASLQLRDFCIENSADVVLVQELVTCSNNIIYGFENFRQIRRGDKAGVAIIIINTQIQIIELTTMSSQYITVVKLSRGRDSEAITVVSAYFKYNMPTTYFIEKLRAVLTQEPRKVIGADVNGHSVLWHCPKSNNRGLLVEELIEDFDLTVANRPSNIPTYDREGMGSSNINLTLLTSQTRNLISDWTVRDVTDSDHNVVTFNIKLRGSVARVSTNHRFNTRKADWDAFTLNLRALKTIIDSSKIDLYANTSINAIKEAARKAIPLCRRSDRQIGKQPWWTNELTLLRKELARKRRMGLHRTNRQEYSAARNSYLHNMSVKGGRMARFLRPNK